MSRSHIRINQARWRAVRKIVLDRDGWRCRECGKAGQLECDHRIPLWKNPAQDPYDIDGLQSLCRSCHIAKTSRENRKPPTAQMRAWQALVSDMARDI